MTFICDRDALTTYYWSGDQVSKKGGMTGGLLWPSTLKVEVYEHNYAEYKIY
jgi:hypothetical protein